MTGNCDDDWPRDVILDLIMYLNRAKFPRSAEHLADTLMVFETERSSRRLSEGGDPVYPALKVVASKV